MADPDPNPSSKSLSLVDVVNLAGSIASVTGLSLLALYETGVGVQGFTVYLGYGCSALVGLGLLAIELQVLIWIWSKLSKQPPQMKFIAACFVAPVAVLAAFLDFVVVVKVGGEMISEIASMFLR